MILILMADHYSIIIAGSPRRQLDQLCIGHDFFCDPFQGLELVLDLAPTKRGNGRLCGIVWSVCMLESPSIQQGLWYRYLDA
jgi:hypothetical protein